MIEDESEDIDWADYESGPFCIHWGEPGSCEDLCENPECKHMCKDHSCGGSCDIEGCKCEEIEKDRPEFKDIQ